MSVPESPNHESAHLHNEMPLLGDHPVMDLLNTVARPADEIIDTWQTDADILRWLTRTGLLRSHPVPQYRRNALLETARTLREIVRTLITQRKRRKSLDLAPLNDFLAQASSFTQLERSGSTLTIQRRYTARTPQQLLAPLAESAADFLATADFDLVRPCEGEGCILWFYDRTKSHRRRWCSMQVCGNRHKVASFRSRNTGTGSV